MKLLSSTTLFFVISIALPSEAYRILGLFPINAKSHFAMFSELMKGLAERGHQVDVVSHFPLKKPFPNYNDVVNLDGTLPVFVNSLTIEMLKGMKEKGSSAYQIATIFGIEACNLMNHPEFKNLIKNPPQNPPYDLVIVEIFGANCYLAMGQHLKVPVVGVISASMLPWANHLIANPDNTAYIPNIFSGFGRKMNFWQRIWNTVINFRTNWEFHRGRQGQDEAIKKYIGPHAPSLTEAEKNVSLILVNSHYTLQGPRPFTTAVVEVGGLHINEKEAMLPNDLQKWLDDSVSDVIYISFGSMMRIESLPKEIIAVFYTSLAKLAPIRVLMKVAKPEQLPPGIPSNVHTRPWVPQLAVLKHKNVRAFMTHGGLMGTQESVYCGVPMIGVPFFGDQVQNIKFYSELNLAVALDYEKLTVKNLDAAFHAVLRDPSYMEAAKKISVQFRDRPMSAMDTAVFWIEYVIRYGGRNLRSPAMDLAPWQIALLDVYGFLLLCIVLVLSSVLFMLKKLKQVFHQDLQPSSMARSKKVK